MQSYNQTLNISSLVPRPIPSFSMSHAEKQESLVREIMCMTPPVDRRSDMCGQVKD